MRDYPIVKDVVLVGGGHAHALVAQMWAMQPMAGVRLTLINPNPAAPYTGMLPGHIAGHYARDAMMIDLVRLARHAGARLILDSAVGLDRGARQVLLQSGRTIAYDLCSIDIGIASDLPRVTGFAEFAHAAKPLGDYARAWEAYLPRASAAPRLVLIGAGVGGVELALASHHRLTAMGRAPQITIVQRDARALNGVGEMARAMLLDQLRAAGITLITGAQPAEVTADSVILTDGRILPSDFTLAVAGARGQGWLADTGLRLTDGHIEVGPDLRSSDDAVFAAGDCAHLAFAPRAKAGVYAVRAAPILAHNLRASLLGQPLRRFSPQRDYLKLISLGSRRAVADKWGLPLRGAWLWRVKDKIDRDFMAKFADYPAMPRPALPSDAVAELAKAMGERPLCGGCGAKLGADALTQALRAIPAPRRADVLSARGDDAAVLRAADGVQVITTDHLRSFGLDPALMARIAATHALGDIWAMGAAPQAALAQITLPPASPEKSAQMLAEVMTAAADVITNAGADMVGGHSAVGGELSIGFTITGLARAPILKGGAQTGDALILTKPLGSGVIMAAEMALARLDGLILGETVAGALALMLRGQGAAAQLLAPHAHAMTDVTGFGLAGHLLEMLDASRVGAALDAAAIPLMAGAAQLVAAGHGSSLLPANIAAHAGRVDGATGPLAQLLHDPQTAGGLLAAVPAPMAQEVLSQLRDGGDQAAVIGLIVAGPARITLR
ncbi:MAG: selenide, water dikinase SelD [Cypionkella sp.]|nr:selenide, water dikinase SelD [Cypionkella sp.]